MRVDILNSHQSHLNLYIPCIIYSTQRSLLRPCLVFSSNYLTISYNNTLMKYYFYCKFLSSPNVEKRFFKVGI